MEFHANASDKSKNAHIKNYAMQYLAKQMEINKMKRTIKILGYVAVCAVLPQFAHALQFDYNNISVKLTGYGTVGMIEPDLESPLFIGDWRARGQITYAANTETAIVPADAAKEIRMELVMACSRDGFHR